MKKHLCRLVLLLLVLCWPQPLRAGSTNQSVNLTDAAGNVLGTATHPLIMTGAGTYPLGAPPQVGGFSTTNTSEAETVSGDCTFARLGLNSYGITCTKTNGVAFTYFATAPDPLGAGHGGTGADLHLAASGTYPKANGSGAYAASTLAAAGTGSCSANQYVDALNGDAAPTCATPSGAGMTLMAMFTVIGSPTASMIEAVACPFTFNFPANFATPNSYATCGTNPSEIDAWTVKVAGSSIGTISLSTTCVATLTTTNGLAQTCTAGQRLELDAPATVSGANIGITLAFTR